MRVAPVSIAACAAVLLLAILGDRSPSLHASGGRTHAGGSAQLEEQQVRATCGVCHALPPPEIRPRSVWRDEFVRMMFIRDRRVPPLGPPGTLDRVKLPPDMQAVLPYFLSRAPERLPPPERWPDPSESPVQFTRHSLSMPDMTDPPAVSNVHLVDFDGDKRLQVLATEMRQGMVFTGHPEKPNSALTVVASIPGFSLLSQTTASTTIVAAPKVSGCLGRDAVTYLRKDDFQLFADALQQEIENGVGRP